MADQQNNAAAALGGMMQGEITPFGDDPNATNQSDDIASIFGLGEEAGPVPSTEANSSNGGSDGGASPSGATPAAEGTEGQPNPVTPPAPQTPQPGQQGEISPPPAQPQAPAAPPAAPANNQAPQAPNGDPTVLALQAQVQALTAHIAQLQQQPPQGGVQQPQQAPNGQSAPDADPYMDYRFGIPDDVTNAIFGDDVNAARTGMAHLLNSMGRIVHERVLKSVEERVLPSALNNFQQQTQLTSQQETMRQEYFASYPQHNDPATRLIVAQEAQVMWTQNPTLQWDENARNALGQRVNARLGYGTPQQQAPTPAPAPTPVPQPAPMMGSSNRPAPNGQANDGDFITGVLTAGG